MNARTVIDRIVERDDISRVNIPQSGKRYARMSGKSGTSPKKLGLYTKMIADLVNRGKVTGFVNQQAAQDVKMA